jgi:hypothetical protein
MTGYRSRTELHKRDAKVLVLFYLTARGEEGHATLLHSVVLGN